MKDGECIVLLDFTENYSYDVQHAKDVVLLLAIIKSKINSTASDTVCYQIISIIMQMLFIFLFITYPRVWKFCYHKCDILITLVMALHSNTKNSKNLTNLIHHQDYRQLSAEWHFFPTSHGKSPCDAMGGTVKCLVPQLSFQNNHILNVHLI